MKIAYGIENIDKGFKNGVVTIGVFDGFHIGHQKIIHKAKSLAKSLSFSNVVITFEPHPDKLLSSKQTSLILTTLEHKLSLFSNYSVQKCLILKASKKIFDMRAEEFVRDILYSELGVRRVVVGENFSFGKDGKGDVNLLMKLGKDYNFKVVSVKLVRINSEIVSSSLIRDFVKQAKLDKAYKALGRNFSILARVKSNNLLIEKIGVSCFNLDYSHEILPIDGWYAIRVKYKDENLMGLALVGADNIIIKSKQINLVAKNDTKNLVVWINIANLDKRIWDKLIEVEFIRLIDRKTEFKDLRQLKNYIIRNMPTRV